MSHKRDSESFCDNAQVVSHSNDMDYVKVKLSEYNVLEYDWWKLTQEVQSLIPFAGVEYKWVQSHHYANDEDLLFEQLLHQRAILQEEGGGATLKISVSCWWIILIMIQIIKIDHLLLHNNKHIYIQHR